MIDDPPELGLPTDEREGLVLFFRVGVQSFGIRLTEVVRINEIRENSVNSGFQEDKVIEFVDLRSYFEVSSGENEGGILIVFGAPDSNYYGILVDAVDEIIPAQQAPELKWPPHLEGEPAKIFGGFFRRGERLVPAINAAAIREAAARLNSLRS